MVVDELAGGRPTGRDAKMEKKAIGRQERAARDASPDAPGSNGAAMYASGQDDYRASMSKQIKRQEERKFAKQEVARNKLATHQAAEKQKMAALLAMAQQSRSSNSLWQPSDRGT